MSGACAVCGGAVRETHRAVVLGRYEAHYLVCDDCGYWFVADPTWLDEAYSSAIAATDTGLVTRNLLVRDALGPVITKLFDPSGVFVDYAGGYGLLVRMMRDQGFDFHWQDAYADNLFAGGLEWTGPVGGASAELVTCVEVFEHTVDPVAFIDEVLVATGTDSIVFSQQLHAEPDPSWWYLAPETGQHISFYSDRTLRVLAERFGMSYHGAGWLHLFTRRPVADGAFARAVAPQRRWQGLLRPRSARPSLATADHERALRAGR